MLNAGTFSIIILYYIKYNVINGFIYQYINYYIIKKYINIIYLLVKIIMTREQSAVVKILKDIKATQRLNARNLYIFNNKINSIDNFEAYFVGLIEGDGWFTVNKKGKYLCYELGIELNIRDIQLIYKLKKMLGIGIVKFRKSKITNENISVIYSIRDKNHIKNIILPIFDKYPMFTKKYNDYLNFKYKLLNNIYLYENSNLEIKFIENNKNINDILLTDYFKWWLIGFIEAEGCFSIYKPRIFNPGNNYIASFEISQSNSYEIIEAIRQYLKITSKVVKNKDNNYRIKTTSIRGIENIILFLKNNPIKLIGYKRLQYILFLKKLRKIERYNKINIPNIY